MGEELMRRDRIEVEVQTGVLERHGMDPHVVIRQHDSVGIGIADHGLPDHEHFDKFAFELVKLGLILALREHVQI